MLTKAKTSVKDETIVMVTHFGKSGHQKAACAQCSAMVKLAVISDRITNWRVLHGRPRCALPTVWNILLPQTRNTTLYYSLFFLSIH